MQCVYDLILSCLVYDLILSCLENTGDIVVQKGYDQHESLKL